MNDVVWVCGLAKDDRPICAWELQGIFDSEEKALAACTQENHFIGPMKLNHRLKDIPEEWVGMRYPLSKYGIAKYRVDEEGNFHENAIPV